MIMAKTFDEFLNESELNEKLRVNGHNFDMVHPNGATGGALKVGEDGILFDDSHFISWDDLMKLKEKYN